MPLRHEERQSLSSQEAIDMLSSVASRLNAASRTDDDLSDTLAQENETLRNENAELREQLCRTSQLLADATTALARAMALLQRTNSAEPARRSEASDKGFAVQEQEQTNTTSKEANIRKAGPKAKVSLKSDEINWDTVMKEIQSLRKSQVRAEPSTGSRMTVDKSPKAKQVRSPTEQYLNWLEMALIPAPGHDIIQREIWDVYSKTILKFAGPDCDLIWAADAIALVSTVFPQAQCLLTGDPDPKFIVRGVAWNAGLGALSQL